MALIKMISSKRRGMRERLGLAAAGIGFNKVEWNGFIFCMNDLTRAEPRQTRIKAFSVFQRLRAGFVSRVLVLILHFIKNI